MSCSLTFYGETVGAQRIKSRKIETVFIKEKESLSTRAQSVILPSARCAIADFNAVRIISVLC